MLKWPKSAGSPVSLTPKKIFLPCGCSEPAFAEAGAAAARDQRSRDRRGEHRELRARGRVELELSNSRGALRRTTRYAIDRLCRGRSIAGRDRPSRALAGARGEAGLRRAARPSARLALHRGPGRARGRRRRDRRRARPTISSPTARAPVSARARSAPPAAPRARTSRPAVDAFESCGSSTTATPPVLPADPAGTHEAIERTVGEVLDAGAIPIVLGGDHSIAEPDIRACAARHGPVGLVHFDTHTDTGSRSFGVEVSHGTPMRRLVEAGHDRPRPLRPDRPPRLLARRGGVRLAARSGDREHLHARGARDRHRRGRRAGGRRRWARGRSSSRSTSTSSTPRSRPAPGPPSRAG